MPLLQCDCFEGLPTPIYHSGQKPGLVCGEVGILDKMRIASTISALSEIYAILLNTPAGVEWGGEWHGGGGVDIEAWCSYIGREQLPLVLNSSLIL